jgi:hypothetical protein
MAHAREPITTILSLVAVASACFVVAKATWPVLLASFVVVSFGLCLYKLVEKEVHSGASKGRSPKAPTADSPARYARAARS